MHPPHLQHSSKFDLQDCLQCKVNRWLSEWWQATFPCWYHSPKDGMLFALPIVLSSYQKIPPHHSHLYLVFSKSQVSIPFLSNVLSKFLNLPSILILVMSRIVDTEKSIWGLFLSCTFFCYF
ncbi:hypothetical protein VPH35_096521 [Triticum aestivum]